VHVAGVLAFVLGSDSRGDRGRLNIDLSAFVPLVTFEFVGSSFGGSPTVRTGGFFVRAGLSGAPRLSALNGRWPVVSSGQFCLSIVRRFSKHYIERRIYRLPVKTLVTRCQLVDRLPLRR
jgi:hypothetical protein